MPRISLRSLRPRVRIPVFVNFQTLLDIRQRQRIQNLVKDSGLTIWNVWISHGDFVATRCLHLWRLRAWIDPWFSRPEIFQTEGRIFRQDSLLEFRGWYLKLISLNLLTGSKLWVDLQCGGMKPLLNDTKIWYIKLMKISKSNMYLLN